MKRLLLLLFLLPLHAVAQVVTSSPATRLRWSSDCDTTACSAVNQACVETFSNMGLIYTCNVSTGKFVLASLSFTGDLQSTVQPAYGLQLAFPRLTSFPTDTTPGACAYILPSDGTHACEGRIACALASGLRCLDGVAP